MDCPWIIKGLQNACIKKNALYREFLRTSTKDAEIRYKRYKNRLTNILRYSKKEYYMKQLDINRNNNKRLWEILNSVIKRGTGQNNYPKIFICNVHEEYNMDVVANSLNEFFVTAGPNLARTITDPGKAQEKSDTLTEIHILCFSQPLMKMKFLKLSKKCKNQKSLDCNDIDMIVVKRVIEAIIKPFTYICNLSFQTGRFPDRMKIAKVIPLYKSGNKHHFTNYRPVSSLPQFSKVLEKLFKN